MSDSIYRHEAVKIITSYNGVVDKSVVKRLLLQMPSAQPETKRAVWALHTYMPHHHYCTHCKKDSPYNKRWSYCPNCGYEMEEYV